MSKKPEVSSREQEREATRQAEYAGQTYSGLQTQSPYAGQQATIYHPIPHYFELSYLKRSSDGALWERHTEYFPTHEDSTARALSLSASGATCVRTLPRYWMG